MKSSAPLDRVEARSAILAEKGVPDLEALKKTGGETSARYFSPAPHKIK
jgi:hypothetical protein